MCGCGLAVVPHQFDVRGHHPALQVDLVDRRAVLDGGHRTHRETRHRRRLVVKGLRQVDPVGEARVDEELLRMQGDEDVRRVEVHPDVAAPAGLRAQGRAELVGVVDRSGRRPAAPSRDPGRRRRSRLRRVVRHGHFAPSTCRASHSSSRPICHSGFPRRGVRLPFGSASMPSTAAGCEAALDRGRPNCAAHP